MRLSYVRHADADGRTWYAVTADDDTPTTYVRKDGRTWQRANVPGHWWGEYRTRELAAQDGVKEARQDRDRARAYDVLGHMDLNTSFDQCNGPVEEWSDGAQWCVRVWEGAREAFDDDHDADDDTASECADAVTPVYTDNVWRVWVDITAYASDAADEQEKTADASATDYAMGVLCDLARTAMTNLFDEWREELKCDECDEYPCVCHQCANCYGDTRPDAPVAACICGPDADPNPGRFPAPIHALPNLPPVPVPDTPRCRRCSAPVSDTELTGTLCGECTDRMHAETAPDPVCCLHCPDGCDGTHNPFCGHCSDGCC